MKIYLKQQWMCTYRKHVPMLIRLSKTHMYMYMLGKHIYLRLGGTRGGGGGCKNPPAEIAIRVDKIIRVNMS